MAFSGDNESKLLSLSLSSNMSTSLSKGSAEDFEIICVPCDKENIRLPAVGFCVNCEEHLCQTCFETHRRPKPSRRHQLLDRDHMPQTQDYSKLSLRTPGRESDDLTTPCSKHPKEIVKFYCQDHEALVCNVCVTLEHTKTLCVIDYIPDISTEIIDSIELEGTLTNIDQMTEKCLHMTADLKQKLESSATSLANAKEDIETSRAEIDMKVDEMEKEAKDTLKKLQHDNSEMLEKTETTSDVIMKSLEASANALKHLNKCKKADQLFTELQSVKQLIFDYENKLKQLEATTGECKEYKFEPNESIETFLQDETSLGTLRPTAHEQSDQLSKQLNLYNENRFKQQEAVGECKEYIFEQHEIDETILKADTTLWTPRPTSHEQSDQLSASLSEPEKETLSCTICVKSSTDKKDCYISGIAAGSRNQVIVADKSNALIKVVDLDSQDIIQCKLDSIPWDVTMTSDDTIAVTKPLAKTIQFLLFTSNTINEQHKLKVEGECYGLSHHHGKLVVTFLNPAKLHIMDMEGKVQRRILRNSNRKLIFKNPLHVATNSDSIFVSDCDKQTVFCFNWEGELTGSYDRMQTPIGIALIDDGSVFVSDISEDECNILHISADCKKAEIVLQDLNYPQAICWFSETETLCVCNHSDHKEERNDLNIYKF
ncbi:E3 ubiquitin-protein ligase TRIM71-like [Ruditapes philippinarum]|uniref:E3 ubiquitin-protein ligase TRIM71-like n=1 Tax=Ruditapes philippinarum TaxID=129788 RepID=UPI00295B701C|nr:E3 ubiquitin-protein ligase TRIM71-like [Ruditapes philippinarum]